MAKNTKANINWLSYIKYVQIYTYMYIHYLSVRHISHLYFIGKINEQKKQSMKNTKKKIRAIVKNHLAKETEKQIRL